MMTLTVVMMTITRTRTTLFFPGSSGFVSKPKKYQGQKIAHQVRKTLNHRTLYGRITLFSLQESESGGGGSCLICLC
jgi:putative transposon-encoded protein